MATAKETRKKVEAGLSVLEQMIRRSPVSPKTGRHTFEGAISVKTVLRLGGVKSAATLHHSHHVDTKRWLAKQIDELKALAGRGKYRKPTSVAATQARNREDKLAQELAAANYKLMELESRLSTMSEGKSRKVVQLNSMRKRR